MNNLEDYKIGDCLESKLTGFEYEILSIKGVIFHLTELGEFSISYIQKNFNLK